MSNTSANPYSTPKARLDGDPANEHGELAGRLSRLGAAFLDGLIVMPIVIGVQFSTGYLVPAQTQPPSLVENILMFLCGPVVFLVLNGFLLASRGQTIGKAALSIQIVDSATGSRMPFVRVYAYRFLWYLPLVLMALLIPGIFDDLLIFPLLLVDATMIFRGDRRCLHDLIAGSKVVKYRVDPERPA